jgi:hypothetical protein
MDASRWVTCVQRPRSDRVRRSVTCGLAAVVVVATIAGLSVPAIGQPLAQFVVPDSTSSIGTLPLDLVAADFTGDGRNDVAVASDGPSGVFTGGVSVLPGDGTGNLGTAVRTTLPSDWGAAELAAADFTGDGLADVVAEAHTTGGPGPLFVLTSSGTGAFTVGQQLANAVEGELEAADFNGDGANDLVFSARQSASVNVYPGNGDGTFDPPTTYTDGFGSWGLTVADVDNDGAIDIVGVSGGSPWTMLNQGDGTFGPAILSFSTKLFGIELALADWNGDGILDIADVDASGGHVNVGLGTGTGTFTALRQLGPFALQVSWVTAGDFNGDGRQDIVADAENAVSVLLLGRGDGSFAKATRWVTGSERLEAVRLSADALPDVVSFSSDPGIVHSTVATRTGFRAPKLTLTAGLGTARAGDLNGDSRPDLAMGSVIIRGGLKSVVVVHLSRGGGQFGPPLVSVIRNESASAGVADLRLADVDQDGILDAVGGFGNLFASSSNLFVMLGNGDGTFGPATLFNNGDTNADVLSLAVADVTGDGHLDIVSNTLSKLSVKPGNGDGTFGGAILSGSSGPSQTATLVGDFTGDAVADVVAAIVTGGPDVSSSDIKLEQGAGDGTFTLIQTQSVDSNVSGGESADFNGDGRPDAAVLGSGGSNGGRAGLHVLLDVGAVLGTPTYYARGQSGIAVGDFNLDGAIDIATDLMFVSLNSGTGTFAEFVQPIASGDVGAAADVTGDGKTDIVAGTGLVFPGPAFALYVNATP